MSGSDPTGYGWMEEIFGSDSDWKGAMPAAYLGVVVLGASAGGLAASNFGGGIAGLATSGLDFAGLYDMPGAYTGPAPTGEFGSGASQGRLYNENAGPPPPSALEEGDALACGPARAACIQIAARIANSPAGRAAQRYGTQGARWAQTHGARALDAAKRLWEAWRQPTISFGRDPNQIHHAFRHTDTLGLSRDAVQDAIRRHLPSVVDKIPEGKPLNQVIEVSGNRIQYSAFRLPDGSINVGRIHGVP